MMTAIRKITIGDTDDKHVDDANVDADNDGDDDGDDDGAPSDGDDP